MPDNDQGSQQGRKDYKAGHEPPPPLGSWNLLYLLVLGTLAALVALFAVLSWTYQ